MLTVAIPLLSTSVWTWLLAGEVVEMEAEMVEGWRWGIKELVDVFETALIRDVGSILSDTRSLTIYIYTYNRKSNIFIAKSILH